MAEESEADPSILEAKVTRRDLMKAAAVGGTAAGAIPAIRALSALFRGRSEQSTPPEVLQAHPVEFGFNTHMRAAPNPQENLTLETFKKHVDLLATHNQGWIRFNLIDSEAASFSEPGTINWNEANMQQYDQAVAYAKEHGLKICFVTNVPGYAKNFNQQDYLATTQAYYQRLAERFGNQIDVWQIFNESDVHHYKSYEGLPAAPSDNYVREFAEVVKQASTTIKGVNSDAKTTVNISRWVGREGEDLVAKGDQFFGALGDAIDIISLNLFPDDNQEEMRMLPRYVEHFAHKFERPVAITELGLPTNRFTDEQQAQYTAQAIDALASGKVRPSTILVYELQDETTGGNDSENSFGLLNQAGEPKGSFDTVFGAIQKRATPTPQPTQTP